LKQGQRVLRGQEEDRSTGGEEDRSARGIEALPTNQVRSVQNLGQRSEQDAPDHEEAIEGANEQPIEHARRAHGHQDHHPRGRAQQHAALSAHAVAAQGRSPAAFSLYARGAKLQFLLEMHIQQVGVRSGTARERPARPEARLPGHQCALLAQECDGASCQGDESSTALYDQFLTILRRIAAHRTGLKMLWIARTRTLWIARILLTGACAAGGDMLRGAARAKPPRHEGSVWGEGGWLETLATRAALLKVRPH
jgi:hypothetical protein